MMIDLRAARLSIPATLFVLLTLGGCGDSKFKDLSNSELQDKFFMCESASGLSPGGAIICDNVRRECDNRAKKSNRTICL